MAAHSNTILTELVKERDRINEILNCDTSKLKADLAATERLIAIYKDRADKSATANQPKQIKAAAKLHAAANGNGNGQIRKIRDNHGRLVNPLSNNQQKLMRMIAVLHDPNAAKKHGMAAYINNGLLTRSKAGSYSITAKGKQRLKELTGTDEHAAGSTD